MISRCLSGTWGSRLIISGQIAKTMINNMYNEYVPLVHTAQSKEKSNIHKKKFLQIFWITTTWYKPQKQKKITRADFWIRLKDKLSSQAEHGTNKKLRIMQLGIGMYRCPDSTHTFPMIPKPVNWKLMSSPELHLSVLPFIESSTLCGSKQ